MFTMTNRRKLDQVWPRKNRLILTHPQRPSLSPKTLLVQKKELFKRERDRETETKTNRQIDRQTTTDKQADKDRQTKGIYCYGVIYILFQNSRATQDDNFPNPWTYAESQAACYV